MVLDTCALLWRTFEPESLSDRARRAIESAPLLLISSITVWEIGIKVAKRLLELPLSVEALVDRLRQARNLTILPVDETVWLDALSLRWKHRDPADRVIVATAQRRGEQLVTCDKNIRRFYEKAIW